MSIYSFNTTIFNEQFLPPRKRNTFFKAWGTVLLSAIQWVRDVFFDDYVTGNTSDKILNYSAAITYSVGQLVYYETTGLIYECILSSTGNAPTNTTYFTLKTYSTGNKIIYIDKAVYECVDSSLLNEVGVISLSGYYFIKIQDKFLGLKERTKTTAQIQLFEYILNKWFYTSYNYPSTTNDIYITNTPNDNHSFVFGVTESESSFVAITDSLQETFIADTFYQTTINFTINIPLAVYDALKPLDPSGTTATKDSIVRNFADGYVCAGTVYTITLY